MPSRSAATEQKEILMPVEHIKRFKERLAPKDSFKAHVLTLMTGTAVAQAIPVAASPILTRFYSPADFGIFALYLSLTNLISSIATARYELAIMLPKDDEDAVNLAAVCLVMTCVVSLITLLAVAILNAPITALLKNASISAWLYFVPVTVFFTGVFQTLNYWSNRKKQYKRLAMRQVTQSWVMVLTQIGIGILHGGTGGMVIGLIVGQVVSTVRFTWNVWKEDHKKFAWIKRQVMLTNAKLHQNFPKINLAHTFLDAFRYNSIAVMLSHYFSSAVLGQYFLAFRTIQQPLSLLSSSVSQVFFQKISEKYNKNTEIWPAVKTTMKHLALIVFPVFLILLSFAPQLFALVFGKNWQEAGQFARVLAFWLCLAFVSGPLASVPIVLNKQKGFFIISGIYNLGMPVLLLLLCLRIHDAFRVLTIFSIVASIYLFIIILWIKKITITSDSLRVKAA